MIEEVVSVELPMHERLVVRKNRLMNEENGIDMAKDFYSYRHSWG